MKWDIFCTVIDNYGDIGVTWRLARQLAGEHALDVCLWVDDLNAFAHLCPELDPQLAQQCCLGVQIRHWPAEWPEAVMPADVVIEAFACQLPAAYVQAMAQSASKPMWLNLEYLSAEPWVEGCHGLPSPQAGLNKYFFFPGFSAQTGGLLREQALLGQRDTLQGNQQAQAAFLKRLGVVRPEGARLFSLFAYENTSVASWLGALASAEQPTLLLVPQGRVLADVERFLGQGQLTLGRSVERGSLTVQVLPFMAQDDYDRLLWCCDFNAVRGEDSFVRAQWAARPMLWHIYVQEENAHLEKLAAFLACYTKGLAQPVAAAIEQLWLGWNQGGDVTEAWQSVELQWPALMQHAQEWADNQARCTDLATALVQFYRNSLS